MGRRLYQNTWKEELTGNPNDLINCSYGLLNRVYN